MASRGWRFPSRLRLPRRSSVAARSTVAPDVRLIVTEGNYLLLDVPPWSDLRELLDEVWFCAPPDADRIERLVARHVRFGRSPEAALAWATGSDAANALVAQYPPNVFSRADRGIR